MAHGLLYGASYADNTLTFVDKSGRTICSASLMKCLRLTATQNSSSVALQKEGSGTLDNHYKYSVNGGAWQDYTLTNPGVAIPLEAGDYVEWRCTERNTMQSTTNYVRFVMTGRIEASNPITSIVYDKMSYDDIDPVATTANTSYACYKLFLGCTALTKAPELPATNLRQNCYNTLFSGCTNLTVAPTLPATTVYSKAYSYMFQSTGLTSAPSLPATNIQEMAYKGMFYNCPGLVTPPPELPATSIGANAYHQMFLGCSALTKSPVIDVLSARTRASSGDLETMFYGCNSLNEIKCALNTVPAGDTNYAHSWTFNVAPTGDFYCDPTFPWASGVDGIPVGWDVWVLGAEDTGNTTSMYYRGTQTTVMVGTSEYGACYALQGWVGFKSLNGMHALGYTFGAQTSVTIYKDDYPMTAYTCAAGGSDGFTELMYDACDGKGYRTSAQLLEDGYALHQQPLTLKATADNSSVKLIINGTTTNAYDVDTGNGWEAYTFDTVINLNNGDTCKWRCRSSSPYIQSTTNYVQFVMTGTIEASGSINSMITPSFDGITSIQNIDYAFYNLFRGCTSLTRAPALPATTLSQSCYFGLLRETSITNAPELPATTLTNYCYNTLFYKCESLTVAPNLPATVLTQRAYYWMFNHCIALTEVRIAATDISASDCLTSWLNDVASSGDFYCDPNLSYPESTSGIPNGWNRWVYGATDTGTTTTMYHNGTAETVKVGTSTYGVCYSVQGWVGFKTLDQMHQAGFTFGAQTAVTMYYYDERSLTAYSCAANNDDGFTETMYDVGDGNGYLDIASQNDDGYYLVPTPWTGLKISSGTWTGDYTINTSLYRVGTLNNTFQIDDGSGWRSYTLGTVVELQKNSSLKFRRMSGTTQQSANNYLRFGFTPNTSTFTESSGKITVSGNPYSLLIKTGFDSITTLADYPYALYKLFWQQNAIGSASGLVLPAMTLSTHCYHDLFSTCEYLLDAPELPATTLATYCYEGLYYGCIRLPSWYHLLLPATTLVEGCYSLLFSYAQLINEVRIAATNTTIPTNALNGWLGGAAASGTVYAPTSLNLPRNSVDGVPSGWVRLPLSDYPTA